MNYARHLGCIAVMAILGACGSEPEPPPAAPAPAPAQAATPTPAPAPAAAPVADTTEKMARAVGSRKPGAAVDIKYEFAARPEPGKPVELQIALIPSAGVDAMNVTFTGMEGITLAGSLTASFTSVQAKQPYKHILSVLADKAGVFYVTVSVDTAIGGATLGRTFAIPFVAGSGQVTQQKTSAPVTDPTGAAVEPMQAEETTR